jgi:hypothetical protein
MTQHISFAKKFMICLVLSFLLAGLLLLLGQEIGAWAGPNIIFVSAAVLFLLPLALLPVWEYRDRKQLSGVSTIYQRGQYIIACLCSVGIGLFGWKKVFGMQFRTPLSTADLPMNGQNGETLTWFYFGHSLVFGLIVAMIQLVGSGLLLFPKTRQVGIFLLLPVMLNILLINIFYQMNIGALTQSVILTGSLFYMMFQYRQQLMEWIFKTPGDISPRKNNIQWLIAGLVLLFTFLFVFRSAPGQAESSLFGAYEVKAMTVNGKYIRIDSCRIKDSVLTKIYFDIDNVCVLEYNSPQRRLIAKYHFSEADKILESNFILQDNSYSLRAMTTLRNAKEMELKGRLDNDSLHIVLLKYK